MIKTGMPRQITIAEMAPHVHSFGINENKVHKISAWLINWITTSLKQGKIKPYDFLPSKGELAFHIGVSKGTIQNVFRIAEDSGLIESKQRIGAYVIDINKTKKTEKLTSKREMASEAIKKYIKQNKYSSGKKLIATRTLAKEIGFSVTTVCSALSGLVLQDIIYKKGNNFFVKQTDFELKNIEQKTLVEKIAENIQKYIDKNCKNNDKLPSNSELSTIFNVSIKTVHDSVKLLCKKGILKTRRGQYGTVVIRQNIHSELYCYETVELKIKHFISTECQVGSKLPPIRALARQLNVSSKTINKALNNLAEDGYLTFERGRYGGTFVTDIPAPPREAYTWLAINPDYINTNNN